jgi:colanic acid biosynthesis glycosyl transferase WcaI
MRILFLSTYFKPDIASTGVLMTQLAEDLDELGHEITVVTSMPHYSRDEIWDEYKGKLVHHERNGPVDVHRVYVYVPGSRARSMERFLNYGSFNALSVLKSLSVGKHDVVFVPSPPLTNGLAGDLISRFWGVPFVYNVQDIWPDVVIRAGVLTNQRIIHVLRRLERYVYRRAKALAVISRGFRRNLKRKGVPEEKIEVIPNFFDTDFVHPLPRQNDFSAAHGLDDRFVILFGGNVGHSQGLETVLDAADRLSDLEDVLFLIVGNGAAKDGLKDYAQELGLDNVQFLPFQPHEALPEMYASSDVCLVPLRKGFTNESVPCKVFTITAAARPLVASVDEGSDTWRWVERADCGLLTQPEDAEAMEEAIRALYRDRDLRERMGWNGRKHVVAHYNREVVARRYDELLRSVVDGKD